jgi:hypothetical protein
MPGGIFAKNTLVTDFGSTFQNCYNMQFLADPFIDGTTTNKTNRFTGVSSVNFTRCLNQTGEYKSAGQAGAAPDLWNYAGSAGFVTTACFRTNKDNNNTTYTDDYIKVFSNFADIKAQTAWLSKAP